jgi:ribonuclease J
MLRVFALGGLGEVGMNCLALEQDGTVMLVDCGVTFDPRNIGVDVVHPDFSALDHYKVVGVFITHGHEDHIGALPYLLRRTDVPIWGPRYALGLVRERAAEHEVLAHARLIEARTRQKYEVGPFVVEPVRVTHSIADATALAIDTSEGKVIHTGDFKFDDAPPDGETFDTERFTELGDAGVSLLLSDSTNVDASGPTGGEEPVGRVLEDIVRASKSAVVVAMFASNVHRLRMLGEIAQRTGRKIVPLGRSVNTHARVARATGYLDWPTGLVHPAERVNELPRERILGVATGTQGEVNGALARLARDEHSAMQVGEGDTVVLSSRIIPGNEREVFAILSELLRRGVELRTWLTDRGVHVSGHAHRPEQKRMIEMVRPRAFVPVHGTLHHLLRHAALARELGVGQVCAIENGEIAELEAGVLRKNGTVPTGRVHTWAAREVAPSVLKERMALAQDGVVFAAVTIDAAGKPNAPITIVTRGVVDETLDARLVDDARREARSAIGELSAPTDADIADVARLAIRRSFAKALGFKPNVAVVVLRTP